MEPTELLCSWDSPGKNTGIGCHGFLQGIFLIQGLNPHLLCPPALQADFLLLSHWGKPIILPTAEDELLRKVEMLQVTEIELSYISLYRVEKV